MGEANVFPLLCPDLVRCQAPQSCAGFFFFTTYRCVCVYRARGRAMEYMYTHKHTHRQRMRECVRERARERDYVRALGDGALKCTWYVCVLELPLAALASTLTRPHFRLASSPPPPLPLPLPLPLLLLLLFRFLFLLLLLLLLLLL